MADHKTIPPGGLTQVQVEALIDSSATVVGKEDKANKGAADGYAPLVGGKLPVTNMPTYVVTVAGRSGTVVLAISDIALLQTALDGKAATIHGHVIGDVTGLQAALNAKEDLLGFTPADSALIGAVSGIAQLDVSGKVPTAQLPAIAISEPFPAADEAAMLAHEAHIGWVCIRADLNKSYINLTGNNDTMADWLELLTPTDTVLSVNSKTGAVTIGIADIANLQTLLDGKALSVDEVNIYYVGKHGNDANDGLQIQKAFLTFGAAIAAAVAQTPSITNKFAIYCHDSGTYTESLTIPEYVFVRAQGATINGNHTIGDKAILECERGEISSGFWCTKNTGSGSGLIKVARLLLSGSASGILATSGSCEAEFQRLDVEDGVGVGSTSGTGTMHVRGDTIQVSGTGIAAGAGGAGSDVTVKISNIVVDGAGVSLISTAGGNVAAEITNIEAALGTAVQVSANSELRLVNSKITGLETIAATGTYCKVSACSGVIVPTKVVDVSTAALTINSSNQANIYKLTYDGTDPRTITLNIDSEITIIDGKTNLAAKPVTITPSSGQIMQDDGTFGANYTMDVNGGSVIIFKSGTDYYLKKKVVEGSSGIPISATFSTWTHREFITVPGDGSVITDGVVRVVVPYDADADGVSFADYRFTNFAGTELNANLWDYGAGKWALFLVEVDSIPAGGCIIQMYYGKAGQAAKADVVYDADTSTKFPGAALPANYDSADDTYVVVSGGIASLSGGSGANNSIYCVNNVPAGAYGIMFKVRSSDWDKIQVGLYTSGIDATLLYLESDNNYAKFVADDDGTIDQTAANKPTFENDVWYYCLLIRDTGNSRAMLIANESPFFTPSFPQMDEGRIGDDNYSLPKTYAIIDSANIMDSMDRIVFIEFHPDFTGVLDIDGIAVFKLGGGGSPVVAGGKEAL